MPEIPKEKVTVNSLAIRDMFKQGEINFSDPDKTSNETPIKYIYDKNDNIAGFHTPGRTAYITSANASQLDQAQIDTIIDQFTKLENSGATPSKMEVVFPKLSVKTDLKKDKSGYWDHMINTIKTQTSSLTKKQINVDEEEFDVLFRGGHAIGLEKDGEILAFDINDNVKFDSNLIKHAATAWFSSNFETGVLLPPKKLKVESKAEAHRSIEEQQRLTMALLGRRIFLEQKTFLPLGMRKLLFYFKFGKKSDLGKLPEEVPKEQESSFIPPQRREIKAARDKEASVQIDGESLDIKEVIADNESPVNRTRRSRLPRGSIEIESKDPLGSDLLLKEIDLDKPKEKLKTESIPGKVVRKPVKLETGFKNFEYKHKKSKNPIEKWQNKKIKDEAKLQAEAIVKQGLDEGTIKKSAAQNKKIQLAKQLKKEGQKMRAFKKQNEGKLKQIKKTKKNIDKAEKKMEALKELVSDNVKKDARTRSHLYLVADELSTTKKFSKKLGQQAQDLTPGTSHKLEEARDNLKMAQKANKHGYHFDSKDLDEMELLLHRLGQEQRTSSEGLNSDIFMGEEPIEDDFISMEGSQRSRPNSFVEEEDEEEDEEEL